MINPQNKDHERFKYAVTVGLHYKYIPKNPQRIIDIHQFVKKL